MPYYLHPKTRPASPESDPHANVRADAHSSAKLQGLGVTFIPSDEELESWHDRERARFKSGEYFDVPWAPCERSDLYRVHYAHMSQSHPGMIAYTPDAEHGVYDRQTRIKPGRYLTQFYTATDPTCPTDERFTTEQIAEYVAACAAVQMDLKIARCEADIVSIYEHGPSSCMDGRHTFHTPVHPSAVYAAPSDLGVAYYGSVDNPSQRVVVWPDKKHYTRIYGTGPLKLLLTQAGYTRGSIAGAKVRRIHYKRDLYVMPFVDHVDSEPGAACAMRTEDEGGKFFVLANEGPIDCGNTEGWINTAENSDEDDRYENYSCEHCGRGFRADPNGDDSTEYCQRCVDERWSCDECGTDHFYDDDDDGSSHEINVWCEAVGRMRQRTVCDNCYREAETTCESCDERFVETNDFTHVQTVERQRIGTIDYCELCASIYRYCDRCEALYNTDDDTICPLCKRERCDKTADLLATSPNDPPRKRFDEIPMWSRIRVIANGNEGTKIGPRSIRFDARPTDIEHQTRICSDVAPDVVYFVIHEASIALTLDSEASINRANEVSINVESPF